MQEIKEKIKKSEELLSEDSDFKAEEIDVFESFCEVHFGEKGRIYKVMNAIKMLETNLSDSFSGTRFTAEKRVVKPHPNGEHERKKEETLNESMISLIKEKLNQLHILGNGFKDTLQEKKIRYRSLMKIDLVIDSVRKEHN